MFNASHLTEKWAPVLNHSEAPAITDKYRKEVTAVILENQELAMRQNAMLTETPNNVGAIGPNALSGSGLDTKTGGLAGFDPIMISLVRRAMPNLMAIRHLWRSANERSYWTYLCYEGTLSAQRCCWPTSRS